MKSLYQSSTYLKDLKKVAEATDVDFLAGKSVLITGSTGLIGSALTDLLLLKNHEDGLNITVYAASRNTEAVLQRFSLFQEDHLIPVAYDATKPVDFSFHVDLIIHAASNASPDKYVNEPVDTMLDNFMGVYELLNFAKNTGAERLLYVSSSEVYGKKAQSVPLAETDYGVIDPSSVRSSYSASKLAAETMCVGFASQYQFDVVIARPGHIYGPTCKASDRRVSSEFPRLASRSENIIMKSLGTQIRSYCHCFDCAAALLCILKCGLSGEAYNISNSSSIITIHDMAEIVAEHAKVQLIMELPSGDEKKAFNPMDNSSLESSKLEALGYHGLFSAGEGLAHTVDILREIR